MRESNVNELETFLLNLLSKEKLAEIYFTTDNQELKTKILKRVETLTKSIS